MMILITSICIASYLKDNTASLTANTHLLPTWGLFPPQ